MDEGDLAFLSALLGDPRVMRFYPKVLDQDEARAWIARQRQRYEQDGHGLWLLERRDTGEPVGQCGVAMQVVHGVRESEVGYLLAHAHWHQGYATEAARAARDWAFARYPGARVISLIRPENAPSRAVAERNGMQVAGETVHANLAHLVYAVSEADIAKAP
ncbi:MAG: GNAT family N-acetyltransferase [Gemmatimonadetes bacterium]|nr:GNAT family N-acetyltransferase [Gemmatimonadota bacterium]